MSNLLYNYRHREEKPEIKKMNLFLKHENPHNNKISTGHAIHEWKVITSYHKHCLFLNNWFQADL